MWDWFQNLVYSGSDSLFAGLTDFLGNVLVPDSSCSEFGLVTTAAGVFALGDLIVSTFFQLAFGRFGMKLSSRSLFVRPKKEKW